MEEQNAVKTLDDIKAMDIKEIQKEIERLYKEHPEEYEKARKRSFEELEARNSGVYDFLVGHPIPSKEAGLRMDYAYFLKELGLLEQNS